MNQIIQKNLKHSKPTVKHVKRKHIIVEFGNEIGEIPYDNNFDSVNSNFQKHSIINTINTKKYQWQFIISIIIATAFLCFLFSRLYQNNGQEELAEELLNTYQLTTLYSDTQPYETVKINSEDTQSAPFVIGMITIAKIDVNYPILSESNDELLKISLCRFYGPLPNENGNLCIAGHNYLNNRFFSRLNELNIGDFIEIYGLSGEKQEYKIFRKYEVDSNNLSCTNQDVGNTKMVTLLTCDNVDQNKRVVVQAKEC